MREPTTGLRCGETSGDLSTAVTRKGSGPTVYFRRAPRVRLIAVCAREHPHLVEPRVLDGLSLELKPVLVGIGDVYHAVRGLDERRVGARRLAAFRQLRDIDLLEVEL